MRVLISSLMTGAILATGTAFAGERQLDPIFAATPVDGQPAQSCFNGADNRNAVVRGATSTTGQTIIGGLLGAALGDQFGSGGGNDLATGVGAALGAASGAWNAQRMREQRVRECQQYQGYANGQQGVNQGSRYDTRRVGY
ncbi:glycine zipper domain-containing protein [Spectribacter hydrogenooxidans]|uniref:Glycine zipper domain-containing protein n=1 Tax=Spectribacter hydrogenoxidans TaxID=3075608 RepID=A0ABU3BZJ4_9GAMM|nr:glycine zipper domain-containing protein [Salinisphaera sp. W335]MDT0634732.1 hypothetical protein [Salinisphaera sp. W335]